jgi:hypothetical protein
MIVLGVGCRTPSTSNPLPNVLLLMKGIITRLVSAMKFFVEIFFVAGFQPWALKFDDPEERDVEDQELILDMLQHQNEILEEI